MLQSLRNIEDGVFTSRLELKELLCSVFFDSRSMIHLLVWLSYYFPTSNSHMPDKGLTLLSEDILAAKMECCVLLKSNGHLLTGACLELTQRKLGWICAAEHVWHCFGKMNYFTSVRTHPNKFSFQDVFLIILSSFTGDDHYVLFACSANRPSDSHPSILHHIPPEPVPWKLLQAHNSKHCQET